MKQELADLVKDINKKIEYLESKKETDIMLAKIVELQSVVLSIQQILINNIGK